MHSMQFHASPQKFHAKTSRIPCNPCNPTYPAQKLADKQTCCLGDPTSRISKNLEIPCNSMQFHASPKKIHAKTSRIPCNPCNPTYPAQKLADKQTCCPRGPRSILGKNLEIPCNSMQFHASPKKLHAKTSRIQCNPCNPTYPAQKLADKQICCPRGPRSIIGKNLEIPCNSMQFPRPIWGALGVQSGCNRGAILPRPISLCLPGHREAERETTDKKKGLPFSWAGLFLRFEVGVVSFFPPSVPQSASSARSK